jgi:hypothetical protein
LAAVNHDERMQLIYYTGNDFSGPLDRYEQKTKTSTIEICSRVRGELASRYRQRMSSEELIQGNMWLCLSTQMPKFVKESGKKVRGFRDVFKVLKRSFDHREQFFDLLLSSYGGHVASQSRTVPVRETAFGFDVYTRSKQQGRYLMC